MVKKTGLLFLCAFLATILQGQIADRVVAVVGNEAILQSDLDVLHLQMKLESSLPEKDANCFILRELISRKLLVAQAKLDSLTVDLTDVTNEVDRRIATQVSMLGGESYLESYYQKPISLIRQELIDVEREERYAQQMQRELLGKVKITPNEVENFYNTIPKDSLPKVPDSYVLYEIVKKPNSDAAVIAVKEQLLDLRKRIIEGEKFQTLATLYSEDVESARRGGELGLSPIEGYVAPVRDALKLMRPGQVSQIVESEYGFHILQLIEKQQTNNLVNYRHILIRPKYTDEDRKQGFARLDSIVDLIKKGDITFERAALHFSDDEKSRAGNGLMFNIQAYGSILPYFHKDEIKPDDYRALEHLSLGEISAPYTSQDNSGNVVYKVIKIKSFTQSHSANLKDDFDNVANLYKRKKQGEKLNDWIVKKGKTAYIRISADYKDCDFVQEQWMIF